MESQTIKGFGKAVSTFRIKSGMSQTVLADLSNIERKHLREIEAGKVNPTLGTLFKIALGLNVKPSAIIEHVELNIGQKR
jgi:transcriptional regulator with XRE-family HTH domain